MKKFDSLDDVFKNEYVKNYYDIIEDKKISRLCKAIFDRVVAAIMLVLFSPIIIGLAIWIKIDSEGPVFYKQKRITTYGKEFEIYKFRTMVKDADKLGTAVTLQNDPRISSVGKKLRKLRLDELPQLINVFLGDMSFVGTRPEVKKYVDKYTPEMYATLLMPAGITSPASIEYKDEDEVIESYKNQGLEVDEIYTEKVLPEKMKYNLKYIEEFSFFNDLKIMIQTIIRVIR